MSALIQCVPQNQKEIIYEPNVELKKNAKIYEI